MVKVFRALHDGENPDVVLQSAISEAGSSRVPETYGALVGTWPDPEVPAVAPGGTSQSCRSSSRTPRRVAGGARRRPRRRRLRRSDRDLGAADCRGAPRARAGAADRGRGWDAHAALLGSMRTRAATAAALSPHVAVVSGAVTSVLEAAADGQWPAVQRVHGDDHLGQVLRCRVGLGAARLRGRAAAPDGRAQRADLALRDVAGCSARSIRGPHDRARGRRRRRGPRLDGPRTLGVPRPLPVRVRHLPRRVLSLLAALELDKALYECVYESRNRPALLPSPTGRAPAAGGRRMTTPFPSPPTVPQADRRPLTRMHHGDDVVDEYVAARPREPGGHRAPRGGERLHGRRSQIRGAAGRSSARSGSHVGDRPLGAVPRGQWWYYSRTQEGKQYAALPRADPGPDDRTPPVLGDEAPGEQVLLDDNAEAAATILLARQLRRHPGRPLAALGRRHGRRRALRAARQGPHDRRAAAGRHRGHDARRAVRRGRLRRSTTRPATRRGGPTPCSGTCSAPTARTRSSSPSPTSATGSASG